jgi:hypothetical protein
MRKIHDGGFYSDITIIRIYVFLCMYKFLFRQNRGEGEWNLVPYLDQYKGPRSLFKERNAPLLP